jgi:hypothetical protein
MQRKKIIGFVLICIFLMLSLVPMTVTSIKNTKENEASEKSELHLSDDDDYDITGGRWLEFHTDKSDTWAYMKVERLFIRYVTEDSREILFESAEMREEGVFYAEITAKIFEDNNLNKKYDSGDQVLHEETGFRFFGRHYGFDD